MSDYLEGSLSRRDRRRLEQHLAGCPHCSAYLEQMRVTIAASGVVTPEDLAPEALDDLVEIFRQFHEPDET
jgi:anti-sigma factor RsiW